VWLYTQKMHMHNSPKSVALDFSQFEKSTDENKSQNKI
jgi:hypothetical protein